MTDNTQYSDTPSSDPLGKVLRISQLLDLYGGLLTDKQRTFIHLHYEDDLSFGEIAAQHGVSRQAIHDAARHAEESLERYENHLSLLARGFIRTKPEPTEQTATSSPLPDTEPTALLTDLEPLTQIARTLSDLARRVGRSGGVIYDGEGVARELKTLSAELDTLISASEPDGDSSPPQGGA